MLLVSVGQAAANALANWLRSQLSPDVTVIERWPEASVDLFAPAAPGDAPQRAVVSILAAGKRQRLDVVIPPSLSDSVVALGGTPAMLQVTQPIGAFTQPLQLDVWAKFDVDRDDVIAQLDAALTTGAVATGASASDDPVRDGVLLPLLAADGYAGNIECWLDEPDVSDDPEAIQRDEYRATYFGEARGLFSRTVTVPALAALTQKLQSSTEATPPPGTLYQTATMTPNPSPPPAVKTAYGTSS